MACANCLFFFFNDTATTEIYTLSLHDALPIYDGRERVDRVPVQQDVHLDQVAGLLAVRLVVQAGVALGPDRKSTRLNSSHANISYAVFCLKKKKYSLYISTSYYSPIM